MTFICNCRQEDIVKIKRLGLNITFGDAQATPGFTARENRKAGLVGVYEK